VWQPVPDEAVITEPNKVGRAMKWIFMENGQKRFRCFPAGERGLSREPRGVRGSRACVGFVAG
jgi:hypothetical protein